MGFFVWILLAGLEIGLGIWTLTKQKERTAWKRNRFWISVVQWGIVAIILLLPIGNKGLRFAVCFLLLCVRLLIYGGRFLWSYLREKRLQGKALGQTRGTARTIVAMLLGCVLLWISLIPGFVFTGYEGLPTTGEYGVGMMSAILTDETRLESFETDGSHREVPIYVYYPEKRRAERGKKAENPVADGKFPLIFFSHGAFGYYQSNSSTYMELASHGYVVISMDHPYHSFFTKDTEGKTILVNPEFIQSALRVGNAEDGEIPEEEIFQTTREWMKLREEDMSFVMDEVRRQSTAFQGLEGMSAAENGNRESETAGFDTVWHWETKDDAKTWEQVLSCMDMDQIGLMGHSMGGATSVTIGRLKSDVVDAVIDLDGTMLGEQLSFENGTYQYLSEPYPVPLLAINNESHQKDLEEYGALYVNGSVLANARDARYTYFMGSGHMNFTDLPLISPILASKLGTGSIDAKECVVTMNGVILQFFDHYLKGTGELQIQEAY